MLTKQCIKQKKAGRSRFNYFTPSMQKKAQKRKSLLSALYTALELNEFQMYYQPIIDLQTNEIYKAEALIRWNHTSRGLISPDDFIPLAEQSGLIVEIGNWVYKESIRQIKQWMKKYKIDFTVSINMSLVSI